MDNAEEVHAPDAPRPVRARPVDPRLLRYAQASRPFFIALGILAIAQTAVIAAFAWLLTSAVVGVIDGMSAGQLSGQLAALAGVVVLRGLLVWARDALSARAAARVQNQLRSAMVSAIDRLGPEWLARNNTARLALTAGHGLQALEAYFGRYLPQLVMTAVATPILLVVIWWQDWISGITVAITLPIIPVFMVLIGLATRVVQNRQWQTLNRLATRFSDTVRGLSTLIIFGRQHRAVGSIAETTEKYRSETMKVLRVSFLSGFALEFLASISVAIVAVSIGLRLVDGSILLSVGLFVLLLAPEAYLPIRQVGVQFHAAAEGVAATEDIFTVLDAANAASERTDGSRTELDLDAAGADIQDGTRHGTLDCAIRVRRGERELPAVSLRATPGTVTLIEGPSGAGKSSVFAALRGVAKFRGELRWRGAAVTEVADHLAWAGQHPGLIAGSVASNVALGDDQPRADLVRRALELACAEDIDPELVLGVTGTGVSGGQAQRIAVARALYRHLRFGTPIIALDEPSSALDAATETRLWAALRSLADAGATVLLISHRMSARTIADTILTLSPNAPATAVAVTRRDSAPRHAFCPETPRTPVCLGAKPVSHGVTPTPNTPAPTPNAPDRARVRAVLRQAMPPARRFWRGALAALLAEASAVALLAVSAWLIVRASEQPPVLYLTVAIVGVRLFALTRSVFRYLDRLLGHDAALRQLVTARTDLVRRLIPLAPAGLSRSGRGGILTALVDDVDELQNLPLRVVQPLVASTAVAVLAVALVAVLSWPAALVLAAALLVAAAVALGWGWASGARAERGIAALRARLADALNDHLSSLDVLLAFGAGGTSQRRIARADAALRRAMIRQAGSQAGTAALISLLAGASSIAILAVVAPGALAGPIIAGPIVAVVALVPLAIFEVFAVLPLAASAWRQVHASAQRIASVVPAEIPAELVRDSPPVTGAAPALGAGLALRGVSATWPGSASPALTELDLDLAPGERLLVVGASGAGKSTLAYALVRLLHNTGTYTIGGMSAHTIAPDDLRRTVGLCEQNPMLFDEDIRQNLLFARDTATDEQIEDVLARVGLGQWLRQRGGLSARVGERGALVSGGQAQRLALARALLRGFPVLVLDEPTAGVDPAASDALLTDLLTAVRADQAVIVISHVGMPAGLIDRTISIHNGRTMPAKNGTESGTG